MQGFSVGDLERELTAKEREFGGSHPIVGDLLTQLADLYFIEDKPAIAEPLYWRALEIRYQQYGSKHLKVAQILQSLGETCEMLSRTPMAIQLYQEALQMKRELLGAKHPEVESSMANLEQCLGHMGSAEKIKTKKTYFLFGNEEFPVTA